MFNKKQLWVWGGSLVEPYWWKDYDDMIVSLWVWFKRMWSCVVKLCVYMHTIMLRISFMFMYESPMNLAAFEHSVEHTYKHLNTISLMQIMCKNTTECKNFMGEINFDRYWLVKYFDDHHCPSPHTFKYCKFLMDKFWLSNSKPSITSKSPFPHHNIALYGSMG